MTYAMAKHWLRGECNLRMLSREAQLQNQYHATAKTNRYSAHNSVSPVAHTGVPQGPNWNLNTFIINRGL